MSKSKKSGLGKFVLGALVGAGIGVLFAPKKGSETRAELKVKLNELAEKANFVKNNFSNYATTEVILENGKTATAIKEKASLVIKDVLKRLEKEEKTAEIAAGEEDSED